MNLALRGQTATAVKGSGRAGKGLDDMTKPAGARRAHHLRVPVFPYERTAIEANAKATGKSVASFLRDVGMGHEVRGVLDYERVEELARINGDLGRLGGLLKLWLTDDPRTAQFGEATIRALLLKIEQRQSEMHQVMASVVRPRIKAK